MEHWKDLVNRHLRVTLSTGEYQQLTRSYLRVGVFDPTLAGEDYWSRMPRYLLARCPICAATWSALLDTYGLDGWNAETNGKTVFMPERQEAGCKHWVAVQNFVHRHGVAPVQRDYYFRNINSEVPLVMPIFLPDDVESYAVMHAVPVCRVEQEQFVPRFTVFIVTYYSTRPKKLIERRAKEIDPDIHWPDFMYTPPYVFDKPEAWDLPLWVKKGKLLWLDLTQDDLPLKAGPVQDFPYGNVEGIRRPHTHRGSRVIIK